MWRMSRQSVPWDIYVDEQRLKGAHRLGMLVVPNTPSFERKLFRSRAFDGRIDTREVHWNNLSRTLVPLVERWFDCLAGHRRAGFEMIPWPTRQTKQKVILDYLERFTSSRHLSPPYNIVVFLDFDTAHATDNAQNEIRSIGRISRCYHLDGTKNDCLQCCDLCLGAASLLDREPRVLDEFGGLWERRAAGERLTNSEVKRMVAGLFATRNLPAPPARVDPRLGRSDNEDG